MTTTSLRILVNGEPQRVASPATVGTLVALRRPRPPFAVEVNRRLVRRAEYESTPLAEGDCVEIVTLVGGG
ncbi:MAG: thiamine biosynthesis protein ThiS [Planctomycetota bacterium]|nr:MAG: thiamine biosynthesis protein ThiS [Planctomycetota bacterium]